jgi:hypothetical protein
LADSTKVSTCFNYQASLHVVVGGGSSAWDLTGSDERFHFSSWFGTGLAVVFATWKIIAANSPQVRAAN